jgi:selenocysteine lyase/cysteine desulfurase
VIEPMANTKRESVSRRRFFRGVLSASAAVATLAQTKTVLAQSLEKLSSGLGKPGAIDADGGYWAKIRNQFMLEDGLAYLNTATFGPTPRLIVDAMGEYWRLLAVNPNENSAIFQERQDQIRAKAAAFIGATPDEVALTRNTTEGTTILAHGLDLKAGDEILMTAYEHPSLHETWTRHAKRFGLVLKEVQFPMPPTKQQILDAFAAATTNRTRVYHFANPLGEYGVFTPVKELVAMAHSKQILCFVDAAHSPGLAQFSVADWGVDGISCNAHKWLCGAAGAGLLYVRKDLQDRIWPNISISAENLKGARRYDQLSRRPWPCVMAFEDILDWHIALGRTRLESRAKALGTYLRAKAVEIPNVIMETPMDPTMSSGTTTLGIKGVDGAHMKEYLRQKYDAYVTGGGKGIRVSTHFFNTYEQADRVLSGLRDLSKGVS